MPDPAAFRSRGSIARLRRPWPGVLLLAALAAAPVCGAARLPSRLPEATDGVPARGSVERRVARGERGEAYLLYVPATAGPGTPVLVDVHGISRNVEEHATLLAPFAERYGVILVAPCFTREEHAGYQWLGREPDGGRADLDLDAMLEDVRSLTGADVRRIHLFGFSGGAQFVHRYALAHPERVAGVVVASAGWYTFPDSATPYPYGLGASEARAGLRFEPERFLRVPITVLVGGDDTGTGSLRREPDLERRQGAVRRDRARAWVAAMRSAAIARGLPPLVTGEEVPGIRHSFGQFMREGRLGERVFGALFGAAGPAMSAAPAASGR